MRRPLWIVLGVAAGVVALDQISKWWVQQVMPSRAPIDVIGDWLQITYTRNPGAAFSLGGSFTVVLSVIAITVAVVIVRMASKLGSVAWAVALGGVLGGALGNLIDRLLESPWPLSWSRRRLDRRPELSGVQHRRLGHLLLGRVDDLSVISRRRPGRVTTVGQGLASRRVPGPGRPTAGSSQCGCA